MLLLAIEFNLPQKGKPGQIESQANIRERKKREYKKKKKGEPCLNNLSKSSKRKQSFDPRSNQRGKVGNTICAARFVLKQF